MKKIFILLAFMLTVQFSIAQTVQDAVDVTVAVAQTTDNVQSTATTVQEVIASTTEAVPQTITEAERIVDKYGGKISGAISSLADALKVSAEHVYMVLVRQQVAEGISVVLLLVVFIIIAIMFSRNFNKADYKDSQGNRHATMSIILGICTAVLGVILIFILPEAIIKLINPEYGAIKEIFELVKTLQESGVN